MPASTQWEAVRDHVDAVAPVHGELFRRAASGRGLHNDDTSVRILELMGKHRAELLALGELPNPDRTGLFTTGIVSITADGPIALFFSGRKHGGENFTSLLAARDPALPPPIHMCDGLDRNRPHGHVVIEASCNAHGRRHIVDEAADFPPSADTYSRSSVRCSRPTSSAESKRCPTTSASPFISATARR